MRPCLYPTSSLLHEAEFKELEDICSGVVCGIWVHRHGD